MCGPLNLVDSIFGPVWFSLPLLMCPGAVVQGSGSLPQARPTTCCGRRPVLWLLLVVAAPRPASLPPRQQQQRLASSDLGRGCWSLPQGPERPASRDTRLPPVWPCVALCAVRSSNLAYWQHAAKPRHIYHTSFHPSVTPLETLTPGCR